MNHHRLGTACMINFGFLRLHMPSVITLLARHPKDDNTKHLSKTPAITCLTTCVYFGSDHTKLPWNT